MLANRENPVFYENNPTLFTPFKNSYVAPRFIPRLFDFNRHLSRTRKLYEERGATINGAENLNIQEQDIFTRVSTIEYNKGPLKSLAYRRDIRIMEALGVDMTKVNIPAANFYLTTIGAMDHYFDTNRGEFEKAMRQGGNEFFNKLSSISVQDFGKPIFRVGQMFRIIKKYIQSASLYPDPSTRSLLQEDITQLIENAIKKSLRVYEHDPLSLSSAQTEEVKTTYITWDNNITFDLACGVLLSGNEEWYYEIRNRYVNSKLANKYRDDLKDVREDFINGNVNYLLIYAKEMGELSSLVNALDTLPAASNDPVVFADYCRILSQVAPQSFKLVMSNQNNLLKLANLPLPIDQELRVPNLLN